MSKRLSSPELERYRRDGCLHPVRLMDGEEMAEHRRRLESSDLVTAWVALTGSDPGNGCMRFISGIHGSGKLAHEDTYDAENILHRGQRISVGFDEADAVDIVLAPGEASLHHGWVVHASNPNTSNERRFGLTIQYAATSVRQTVADRESATLVRGTDRFGHFQPEPTIDGDFSAEGVAFQQQVERLKRETYDKA